MNKYIALCVLLSLGACGVNSAVADDFCFIGSSSPLTGAPGSAMPVNSDNQPILDEAAAISGAFGSTSPLFESDNLYDFSSKLGNVYVGKPLIDYLAAQNGADPTTNGVGFMVAHEYAHQFQFKVWASGHDAEITDIPLAELQADIVAASWFGINDRYVLAAMRRQIGPSFDRQIGVDYLIGKTQNVALQSGDYMSWTPAFHGTDDQRKAAVKVGVQYGEDFYEAMPATAYQTYANEIYDYSKHAAEEILAN